MEPPKENNAPEQDYQPLLNPLYHTIVLPPTNFESVYDQRDNDEVLSDIRQVKSELENSVLTATLDAAEAFDSSQGVVVIMGEDGLQLQHNQPVESNHTQLHPNTECLSASDDRRFIQPTGTLVAESPTTIEVHPIIKNAVESVVNEDTPVEEVEPCQQLEQLNDAMKVMVTIKVEDRQPGEPVMEIMPPGSPEPRPEPETPVDDFCRTYTTENMRKQAQQEMATEEPLKDVIRAPRVNDDLLNVVKENINSFREITRDATVQLLDTDDFLLSVQKDMRQISAPLLQLARSVEQNEVDTKQCKDQIGRILCQLVMLNEKVTENRRSRILKFFNKKPELAAEHRMPRADERLFSERFVLENSMGVSKRRRKNTRNTQEPRKVGIRPKRRRKSPNGASDDDWAQSDVEAEPDKDFDVYNDENFDEIWDNTKKTRRTTKSRRKSKATVSPPKKESDKQKKEKQIKKLPSETELAEQPLVSGTVQQMNPEEEELETEDVDDADLDADFQVDEEDGLYEDDEDGAEERRLPKGRRSEMAKIERKMDNSCDHCKHVSEKRRQLILHVKNSHPDKMISCDLCDKKFAFQISLWNHKNAMHLGAEFKCPQCTRSFKDEEKLRTHMFVHSEEKPFTCEICGKGCLTKVHLDSHIKVHERRNNLFCQLCKRYFGSNHTFRNHMKLHSGEKEWFCDICNAGFAIKPRLVLHKKIAHSDEQFVCDECGKGFKMKHILNDHKALIHSTKKAFVCEICGVGFKLRSVLRRHMKTHSDERPHKCELCDKAFKVKSTLVEHRKTHTNEKPYLCEQCGMAFKRNAERRKHNCLGKIVQIPVEEQPPQQVAAPAQTHHIVTHMPIPIGSQMIQIMQTPHAGTLVATASGTQLMQVHEEQLQASSSTHAQFANFTVS